MKIDEMAEWLVILQGIPFIGPILSNIVFLVPPIIASGVILISIALISTDFAAALTILVFSVTMTIWLRFLENRAGLIMYLPIPLIKIPWIVIAVLGILFGIQMFVTGISMMISP